MSISKIILSMSCWLTFNFLAAQNPSPVSWSFEIREVDSETIEIKATASMKTSWVIYSQLTEDDGPIPTTFMINGEVNQWEELSKSKTEFDELFEVNVTKFHDKAVFSKKLEKKQQKEWLVEVEFMTCDGQKCLPPATISKKLSL